jgi:hypothetical protein
MLISDNLKEAVTQEALIKDERIFQYWDGQRALGRLVSETLKLSAAVAWDIYLLYLPGAIWNSGRLPKPDFWMHQLNEQADLLLDPDRLIAEVQKAIETTSEGDCVND